MTRAGLRGAIGGCLRLGLSSWACDASEDIVGDQRREIAGAETPGEKGEDSYGSSYGSSNPVQRILRVEPINSQSPPAQGECHGDPARGGSGAVRGPPLGAPDEGGRYSGDQACQKGHGDQPS